MAITELSIPVKDTKTLKQLRAADSNLYRQLWLRAVLNDRFGIEGEGKIINELRSKKTELLTVPQLSKQEQYMPPSKDRQEPAKPFRFPLRTEQVQGAVRELEWEGRPFGLTVQELRSRLGISQTQLAEMMHISKSHLNRLERGKTPYTTISTVRLIAESLGLSDQEYCGLIGLSHALERKRV